MQKYTKPVIQGPFVGVYIGKQATDSDMNMSDQQLLDRYLTAYANGTLSDGMSLLIASFLTYSPEARAKVADLEVVAGAMLEELPVQDLDPPGFDAVMARIDEGRDNAIQSFPKVTDARVPSPLRSALDGNLDDLRWKFRMPGLSEYCLDSYEGEAVSLLRAKPGTGMLAHTHEGEEATLILTGQMADGDKVYRAGDIAVADHHHDHCPKIIGDETCYCLIVMSGSMKFTGPVGRALNLFT